MNEEYKPSLDFVSKVMERVHAYEASKSSFTDWLFSHPYLRFALAGSGALFGIFKAASAF